MFTTGDRSHVVSYPSPCDPSPITVTCGHTYAESSCTNAQYTYTPTTYTGNIPYRGSPHVCALHSHLLKGPVSKGKLAAFLGAVLANIAVPAGTLCTVGRATMQAATQGKTHPPILVQCEYRIQLLKETGCSPFSPLPLCCVGGSLTSYTGVNSDQLKAASK